MEDVGVSSPLPDAGFWSGQRVLLTGHTGFKGSWASLWLEQLGATVHGFSLPADHQPDLHSRLQPFARATSTIGDLRDVDTLGRAIAEARPTIVLHMAAQPLVRRAYAEPAATFATNVTGTINLLEALRDAPGIVAVLVVTTDKVYRNDGSGQRFREASPLGGHDPYSASKAAAEIVAASYADSYFSARDVRVATARAGNVIGGGDWSPERLIPDVWRAAQTGKALELRYPRATRPWQHVLDSLSGYLIYLEAMARGQAIPAALNFGPRADDPAVCVSEIAKAMAADLGVSSAWHQAPGDQPVEAAALALDASCAYEALGWQTRLTSRQAVTWSAAWYREFDDGADARAISLRQLAEYEAIT